LKGNLSPTITLWSLGSRRYFESRQILIVDC